MCRFIIGLVFWGISASLSAQTEEQISQQNKPVLYQHHTGAVGIYTQGWGFFYEYGFGKKQKVQQIVSIEWSVLENIKERTTSVRVPVNNIIRSFNYVYGKQNAVYPVKIGYGQQYNLGLPNSFKGLRVDLFYKANLNIALVRPYYLTVLINDENNRDPNSSFTVRDIKYNAQDSVLFLSEGSILQHTGFFTGWSELRAVAGLGIGGGARFNFAPSYNGKGILGLEVSVHLDIYTQEVPIMVPTANVENSFFALQGRLLFYFGDYKNRNTRKDPKFIKIL